jgi:hypothetical protein
LRDEYASFAEIY